jgi:hypothetical protein
MSIAQHIVRRRLDKLLEMTTKISHSLSLLLTHLGMNTPWNRNWTLIKYYLFIGAFSKQVNREEDIGVNLLPPKLLSYHGTLLAV